jgi:hypothetical protein
LKFARNSAWLSKNIEYTLFIRSALVFGFCVHAVRDRLNGRKKGNPMANSTRRTILQLGSAAVAGGLLALNSPKKAQAQIEIRGVFHVFAFQWKPDTSDAQKERARKDIAAFQGVIPGLLQTHVGPNISPRGKGYTFGGIMQFKDEASLNAYFQHPSHQALLAWLVPLIDAVELDLRA